MTMLHSRRAALASATAALALTGGASAGGLPDLAEQIRAMFQRLPGKNTLLIWAPATKQTPEVLIFRRAKERVFVASAFKSFVLAERLRQLDSPDIVARLKANELRLDDSVWSLGSDIFNPPDLSGKVSERTAAEAMILHSDNTGTDMMMKLAGPANIRSLIADFGFEKTQIPDSTRAFTGYLLGLQNYLSVSWSELLEAIDHSKGFVHPFLNDVQTLASTAADLVGLYARTLRRGFFTNSETLHEYRRILALADGVFEAVPLGTSGFAKTGYADAAGFHVRSNAGAMTFSGRWVFFASIISWDAPAPADPETVTLWTEALRESLRLVHERLA